MKKKMIHAMKHQPTKIDINQYIVSQIKRKVSPFYMQNSRMKFKRQIYTALNTPNQKRNIFSQPQVPNKNQAYFCNQIRNKLISEMCYYDKQNSKQSKMSGRYSHLRTNSSNKKYNYLLNKVQNYISEQKRKIQQKQIFGKQRNVQFQKQFQSITHRKHHRKILTSLTKPFDFGNLQQLIKGKKQQQFSQPLFFLTEKQDNNAVKVTKTQRPSIYKNKQKQQIQVLRKPYRKRNQTLKSLGSNNISTKSIFHLEKSKDKRKNTKKSSIMLRTLNSLEGDNIDLQFQQGLIQDIYTIKRIRFRKKINQAKSRKNIYDGKLYFLKQ